MENNESLSINLKKIAKRILIVAFILFLIFIVKLVAERTSSEYIRSKLKISIQVQVNDYVRGYVGSEKIAKTLVKDPDKINTISKNVVKNMSDEDIDVLANEIADYVTNNIDDDIISGKKTLDSDKLMKKINDIINGKFNKQALTQTEIDALKASLQDEFGEMLDDKINDAIDETLIKMKDNMTINGTDKQEYLESLRKELLEYAKSDAVEKGKDGENGKTPSKGTDYYTETEVNQIISTISKSIVDSDDLYVTGTEGIDGDSPYKLAVKSGFVGTEEEWQESLLAYTPEDGTDYFTKDDTSDFSINVNEIVLNSIKKSLINVTSADLFESVSHVNESLESLNERATIVDNRITTLKTKYSGWFD